MNSKELLTSLVCDSGRDCWTATSFKNFESVTSWFAKKQLGCLLSSHLSLNWIQACVLPLILSRIASSFVLDSSCCCDCRFVLHIFDTWIGFSLWRKRCELELLKLGDADDSFAVLLLWNRLWALKVRTVNFESESFGGFVVVWFDLESLVVD
jgi:hypothetical protein